MSANSSSSSSAKLPLKPIPGNYGLPFIGPIKDHLDYFYNQGLETFFQSRIEKYQSTVFRTNMPPGPFISSNPRVVTILDAISFPILFDNSKVEKFNVF
jgi:hydroperoxide dehydratase